MSDSQPVIPSRSGAAGHAELRLAQRRRQAELGGAPQAEDRHAQESAGSVEQVCGGADANVGGARRGRTQHGAQGERRGVCVAREDESRSDDAPAVQHQPDPRRRLHSYRRRAGVRLHRREGSLPQQLPQLQCSSRTHFAPPLGRPCALVVCIVSAVFTRHACRARRSRTSSATKRRSCSSVCNSRCTRRSVWRSRDGSSAVVRRPTCPRTSRRPRFTWYAL